MAIAAGVIAMAASASAQTTAVTAEGILKLLPAETNSVAAIDVKALRSVPLVQELIQTRGYSSDLKALSAATGFQPERDADRVTFAQTGKGRVAMIAEASYDRAALERYVRERNAAIETYRGHTLYGGPDRASSFSFVDRFILGGDTETVKQVLDRMTAPAPNATDNASLMARVRTIEPDSQIWAVGQADASLLQSTPLSVVQPLSDLMKSLTAGVYQMRIDQDIHVKAVGEFQHAESARTAADLLRGLIAVFRAQAAGQQAQPEMVKFLDSVQIDSQEASLTVVIDAPGELLKSLPLPRPAALLRPVITGRLSASAAH